MTVRATSSPLRSAPINRAIVDRICSMRACSCVYASQPPIRAELQVVDLGGEDVVRRQCCTGVVEVDQVLAAGVAARAAVTSIGMAATVSPSIRHAGRLCHRRSSSVTRGGVVESHHEVDVAIVGADGHRSGFGKLAMDLGRSS